MKAGKGVDMRVVGEIRLWIRELQVEVAVGTFWSRWGVGKDQDGQRKTLWFYLGPLNIEAEWWTNDAV